MNSRILSTLSLLIVALSCTTLQPFSIRNDLNVLAEFDQEYAGFKNANVYIQDTLILPDHSLLTYTIPNNGFKVEIEIPANFAAQISGKKLSKFGSKVLSIVRCYLHFTFKPLYPDEQDISLTEVLIFKSSEWKQYTPEVTIRPRGIRSVTAYIQEEDTPKTIIY